MDTKTIHSDLIRGHIDSILLQILCSGDNYGYEIMKAVSTRSKGQYELKEPSLYTSLKRLEKQGYIESYWGDESQGGRRKYYHITPDGKNALRDAIEQWEHAKKIIDQLLTRGNTL